MKRNHTSRHITALGREIWLRLSGCGCGYFATPVGGKTQFGATALEAFRLALR